MTSIDGFNKRFAEALAAAPEAPDCFDEISRRIKRDNTGRWAMRAMAALLLVSLTSFIFIGRRPHEPVAPEVVEELQSIYNHMSGEDIREELVTSSLTGEDSFY